MKFSDYKSLNIKERLYEIVALEMKIKKYFINYKTINAINKELTIYVIDDMLKKLRDLKKDLSKL